MTKLKAFTLIELLVVMLITGVTIAISLWSYSALKDYYSMNDKKEKKYLMLKKCEYLLTKDVETSSKITFKPNSELTFYFVKDSIIYRFYSTEFIRIQNRTIDTFAINNGIIISPVKGLGNSNLVEQINLKVYDKNSFVLKYEFYKNYSSEQLQLNF